MPEVLAVPVPQPFTAETLIVPLVAAVPKLTLTELLVPTIVAPVPEYDQIYEVAPETAGTVYIYPVAPSSQTDVGADVNADG